MEDTEKAIVARKNDYEQAMQELRQMKERRSYMDNSKRLSKNKSEVLK